VPITVERLEKHWLIGLDGEFSITSASELKSLLLEWLVSGRDLQMDLEHAQEIDVSVMQLLWAARREAERRGATMGSRLSEAAAKALQDAGLERFPEGVVQE
jgi:anti-sigma B factor antagonist